MNNISVMFSSDDMTWETPIDLFNKLDSEFHFNTDVCALPDTAKCSHYFTPEIDGLAQEWNGICWMNPPYGKEIGKWMQKAYEESLRGTIVVCLIPARTDTRYWQDYCMKAAEIRFIRGRLRFGNSNNSAPFPSAIVIFNAAVTSNIIMPVDYRNYAFTPVVLGVGYLGYVKVTNDNMNEYILWKSMIENNHIPNILRIIPRWYCFQNFLLDIVNLPGYDKQAIDSGNIILDQHSRQLYTPIQYRIFSPWTCTLINISKLKSVYGK